MEYEITDVSPQIKEKLLKNHIYFRTTNPFFISSTGYICVKTNKKNHIHIRLWEGKFSLHKLLGIIKRTKKVDQALKFCEENNIEFHHIDGNKLNNEDKNIIPLTYEKHEIANGKLTLVKMGKIKMSEYKTWLKENQVIFPF